MISKKYFKYNFLAEIPEKIIYEFKDERNTNMPKKVSITNEVNEPSDS